MHITILLKLGNKVIRISSKFIPFMTEQWFTVSISLIGIYSI